MRGKADNKQCEPQTIEHLGKQYFSRSDPSRQTVPPTFALTKIAGNSIRSTLRELIAKFVSGSSP